MPDPEAEWLDPDWPPRKPLCRCVLCHEALYKGDSVIFTDAGTVCLPCINDIDRESLLQMVGISIDELNEDNTPE